MIKLCTAGDLFDFTNMQLTDTKDTQSWNNYWSITETIVLGENWTYDTLRNIKRQNDHVNYYATHADCNSNVL